MAQRATILLEARTDDAREELTQLEGDLSDVEVSAKNAGSGFQRLSGEASEELSEVRSEANRTAASMRQMSTGASSTANSLGIELTQAAQDASFGVAGVANQIPQLQMEFNRLRSQTGSTTSALSSLASAFAGPTGALAAGTLLLQFLPQIRSAFDNLGTSADSASEDVEGLAEATGNVVNVTSDDLEELELSLDDVGKAIDQTEVRIEALQARISGLQELQSDLTRARPERVLSQIERVQQLLEEGAIDAPEEAGRAGQLFQALQRSEVTLQDLRTALREGEQQLTSLIEERLSKSREELETEKGVKQNLSDQEQTLREKLRAQERASELGAERVENETDAAKGVERQRDAMRGMVGLLREMRSVIQNLPTLGRTLGLQRGRTVEAAGTERDGAVLADPQRDRRARIRRLTDEMRLAGSNRELGRETKKGAEEAGKAIEGNINQTIGRSIGLASQLGSTLVQSAERGGLTFKSVMSNILSTVGGVLSAIPGVGQIAGPALAGAGRLVGSFQHGGTVDTPFQVVGEQGPELAALPQGTQVTPNRKTEQMLSMEPVVRELQTLRSQMKSFDVRLDSFSARDEISTVEQEAQVTGAREYQAG